MRIISGKARGTKINTIDEISTRPTLDRVKESLFNIIQPRVGDAVVLDLFAGSGALGIEALSRGAKKAYFCDKNTDAIKIINQNLEKTRLKENAEIINKDYKKCIKLLEGQKFDIIFLDPPYKEDIAVIAMKLIIDNNLLNENGIIIIETDEKAREINEIEKYTNESTKVKPKLIDNRKYGRANLLFISVIMEGK